jgi:hypothetical protein
MNFLYVLFFIAIVRAETTKDESKEKRDTFLPPIRQTVFRPAMLNRVVQPIIQDVVQPVVHQKTFQTIVNPVSMTHHVAQPMMQSNMFTNTFVKRSADQKEESKEKRDLFLPAIRQTIVRPAMLNRVVQPIIQDVVQPVVHQKTFQTIVNPVSMTHHVAQPMMQNTLFTQNRFVKRSADQKEESKEKRDLFLLNSVGSTFVRPAMVDRVVQPVFQTVNRVVQPVRTFVSPVQVQQVGLGTTFVGNGMRFF